MMSHTSAEPGPVGEVAVPLLTELIQTRNLVAHFQMGTRVTGINHMPTELPAHSKYQYY